MKEPLKRENTIGCCGIDCGLCPRFHTKGDSVCPGCGVLKFNQKHPTCGFLTCCVIKNGLEVCSDCKEYPCKRFDSEKNGYDSFVTHKKVFVNLDYIKDKGIERFIEDQRKRIEILNDLLTNYDDGRSKSFFCISSTLLPATKLEKVHEFAQKINQESDLKEKCRLVRGYITEIADRLNIILKLNKKD